MRICIFIALISVLTAPLAAEMAILEKANAPNWYGAYLLPTEQGGDNLATLRKGLEVEVVHKGERRYKVRVPWPSNQVVVHKSGWPGSDAAEGWVSPRFLKLKPAPVVQEPQETEGDDEESSGGFFSGLNIFGSSDDDNDVAPSSTTSVAEETPSEPESTEPQLGPEGSTPGAEAWRDELPNVYYVFPDMGKDGSFFSVLAKGDRNLSAYNNNRRQQYKNHITAMINDDIAKVGRPDTKIVRVEVNDYRTVFRTLSQGLIPPGAIERRKLYKEDELVAKPCNIVGFCAITHASTDGPVFGNKPARKQLIGSYFAADASSWKGLNTLNHRLVRNGRISFFGCNTGSCQYYRDHSSIAHILAAYYARKNVVVRGKKGIGSPNVKPSCYAIFGLDENDVPRRLSPEKKEYRFYVPLKNYEDENSGRKWVYDAVSVPFSSDEERDAITAYYRERGIRVKVEGNKLVADAPKIAGVTRDSKKDKFLLEIVRALGEDRELNWRQKIADFFGALDDSESVAKVRAMQPFLEKIIDDSDLHDIIETVKKENNGQLDENDFRIWFRIYFQNYKDKNDRGSIAYRACLCCDEELEKK